METSSKTLGSSRLDYIDLARGICMIAIVLGHLDEFAINRFVFTFHLPVFFIISGYFFDPSIDLVSLIKKRFRTLIIPYLTACLLVIISSVAINFFFFFADAVTIINKTILLLKASAFGVGSNWPYPFNMPGIGALWFLWALFWSVIILRMLLYIPELPRALIVCALVFFASFTAEYSVFLPLSIQPGCIAVMYIYVGYLWKKYKDDIASLAAGLKALLAAAAIIYWTVFIISFRSFWLVNCECGKGIPDFIGSICASFLIIALSHLVTKHAYKLTSVIRCAGRYSIIVLTAHIIELNTFPWNLPVALILGDNASHISSLILTIVLKFIWIFLFTFVVSRIRPARKLFGLKS